MKEHQSTIKQLMIENEEVILNYAMKHTALVQELRPDFQTALIAELATHTASAKLYGIDELFKIDLRSVFTNPNVNHHDYLFVLQGSEKDFVGDVSAMIDETIGPEKTMGMRSRLMEYMTSALAQGIDQGVSNLAQVA